MTRKRTILASAVLFIMLLSVGCGGDNGTVPPPPPPPPPPPTLVEQGWTAFEAGDFTTALAKFQEAIVKDATNAEAHDGAGWSSLKLNDFTTAMIGFNEALISGFTGADPHVGRAVILRDLVPVDYQAAIDAANTALAIELTFQFAHDTSLDWRDVRLILAQSYFALGLYGQANTQVDILGGVMQNPASDTYVQDLLAEIERLGDLFRS